MHIHHILGPVLAGLVSIIPTTLRGAVTTQETFSADPLAAGWKVHGHTSLFAWNPTDARLEVTWDSRQPNSYFYRPLGTILSKHDDFALSFDLRLADVQVGIDPAKPFTFQVAVGFINYRSATNAGFLRGTGTDSPNLVTYDYFPDSGFGASVAPGVVSSNGQFAFGFAVFEVTNELVHVEMQYSAAAQKLVTIVTTNGIASAPIENRLGPGFTDFRLDTLAINSYSDAGQDPAFAGSVLAHGTIDNLVVTLPDPPIQGLTGAFSAASATLTFQSRAGWVYHLQRTTAFDQWADVADAPGTGEPLSLRDDSPAPGHAFYRIRAERP